jgi:uridine kinase
MDSTQAAAARYRTYYIPGEELCLAEIRPAQRADIVIDNHFEAPASCSTLPSKVARTDHRRRAADDRHIA